MSRSKAAVATKAAPKSRSRKAAPAPEPVATHGEAISLGMKELADVRTKMRAKRDGMPAKPLVFSEWLKALLAGKAFDPAALAKKYPEIKESSIRSWSSYWLRNNGVGPGYPSNAKGKEKEIRAAIKKAAVA